MIKKTEEIITHKITKKEIFCDDCGKDISNTMSYNKGVCCICRKDLCRDCIAHEDDDGSDYTDKYCKSCWETGKPFREEIETLENKIEELSDAWHKIAKEKYKS